MDPSFKTLRVNHIGIAVENLDEALLLYKEVLHIGFLLFLICFCTRYS